MLTREGAYFNQIGMRLLRCNNGRRLSVLKHNDTTSTHRMRSSVQNVGIPRGPQAQNCATAVEPLTLINSCPACTLDRPLPGRQSLRRYVTVTHIRANTVTTEAQESTSLHDREGTVLPTSADQMVTPQAPMHPQSDLRPHRAHPAIVGGAAMVAVMEILVAFPPTVQT